MSDLLDNLRANLGGTYHIDREIGGGGMSRIFLAEEMALGRRVVLKVLSPELGPELSGTRFEREARVAARLQHPHIVPLLTAGQAGEILYYTMPLVEGESLRTRLDQQRELPVAVATRLFREVADALDHAHRQGVVHRDIKPENILLSHQHAMVTDFGIARAVAEAGGGGTITQAGMAVGTPAYMAPEQAAGDSHIDQRADLYALGVVAYEMLAGQAPFRGSTFQALVAAQLTQVPALLSHVRPSVPAELVAIVHRCLEKRPADRYQEAAELVADLDRVLATHGHGRIVTPVTEPQPTVATAGISRRTMLAGGAALGLGMAGFGFASGIFVGRSRRGAVVPTYHRLTFRRGLIRTARFAPDFQTILYGALWDGDVCRVHTVRPESPESAPLTLPPAAPLAVSVSGELALAMGNHFRGTMTYGTLARVPMAGGAPRELQEDVKYADWSPDGRELLVVRRDDERDLLEYQAGAVLAEPEAAGGGFSFPRFSPGGDAVAVFELDEARWLYGRVMILGRDGVKRSVSERYFNVFGLAWHGDEVWFTAADALPLFRNTIYAMHPSRGVRIVARVPGNTSLHDIAPDGRVLVARTDDRGGMSVRVRGEAAERDLSWLDASVLADISPDGRRILFSETGVGGGPRESAYLRGTDGSLAVRLGDGRAQALSPDGRWAIVRTDSAVPHFDVLPTGAGAAFRLERTGMTMLGVRWLADGGQVVVRAREGDGPARLFVLGIEGSGTRAVTPEGLNVGPSGWTVSPDGATVAVYTARRLELYPVADGPARRVPGEMDRIQVVGWIHAGLLVTDAAAAAGTFFQLDPMTGRRDTWATLQPQDPSGIMNLGTLVTTPDGRAYGYTWHRAVSDLYLVEGWG
jgi:tRNA A-37 threonylcarbamoyl transferase component Bud32